jgi:hypothetical protein
MKISFDYDSTLSEEIMQNLCRMLMLAGADVWILTARNKDVVREGDYICGNKDLYEVSDRLGIPREKIIFTEGSLKKSKYMEHGFQLHIDDMEDEVWEINRHGGNALLVGMDVGQLRYLFEKADRKKKIYNED